MVVARDVQENAAPGGREIIHLAAERRLAAVLVGLEQFAERRVEPALAFAAHAARKGDVVNDHRAPAGGDRGDRMVREPGQLRGTHAGPHGPVRALRVDGVRRIHEDVADLRVGIVEVVVARRRIVRVGDHARAALRPHHHALRLLGGVGVALVGLRVVPDREVVVALRRVEKLSGGLNRLAPEETIVVGGEVDALLVGLEPRRERLGQIAAAEGLPQRRHRRKRGKRLAALPPVRGDVKVRDEPETVHRLRRARPHLLRDGGEMRCPVVAEGRRHLVRDRRQHTHRRTHRSGGGEHAEAREKATSVNHRHLVIVSLARSIPQNGAETRPNR